MKFSELFQRLKTHQNTYSTLINAIGTIKNHSKFTTISNQLKVCKTNKNYLICIIKMKFNKLEIKIHVPSKLTGRVTGPRLAFQ